MRIESGLAAPPRRRPERPPVDPWRPLGSLHERELQPDGRRLGSLTIFLAGAECPFSCVFCDLWRHTTPTATPAGAIPRQIEHVLGRATEPTSQVKLYNASNFFDERAVPAADDPKLLELLASFDQVVVENHPRLVRSRCLEFGATLPGRLQVAMGLETVHPEAFERLDKGMAIADFDAAATRLVDAGHGVRAFVLVGTPFVPAEEQQLWTVRSVEHAVSAGAEHVAIIPVRGETEAMRRIRAADQWAPPDLDLVERTFERSREAAGPDAVVTVDLWDLERAARDPVTIARVERLRRLSLGEPR